LAYKNIIVTFTEPSIQFADLLECKGYSEFEVEATLGYPMHPHAPEKSVISYQTASMISTSQTSHTYERKKCISCFDFG
jgi:hypothetical protein